MFKERLFHIYILTHMYWKIKLTSHFTITGYKTPFLNRDSGVCIRVVADWLQFEIK